MAKMSTKCCQKMSGWEQDTNRMSSLELFTYLTASWRAFHFLASAFSQFSATAENYQLL